MTVLASADGFAAGASTAPAVSIAKMTSTTVGTLSAKRIKRGLKVTLGITVSAPPVAGPGGEIKVMDGRKLLKKITLAPKANGAITVKLPKNKLRKLGRHKIKVFYSGTAAIDGSQSKSMRLVITRK